MIMIRSTRHNINNTNKGKYDTYISFIEEYSRVVKEIVDILWCDGYGEFNINEGNLDLPKYLDYKVFGVETDLSARALQCATGKASGIVRSVIEKQRRVLWVKENSDGKKAIKDVKFRKPNLGFVSPQISSKCAKLIETPDGEYFGFIELKSIGKKYGKLYIPLNKNPRSHRGEAMKSFLFNKKNIQVCWEIETGDLKTEGEVVGLDQGLKDVATLSNGTTSPKKCNHGHSLESVVDKMSRKKKGSKAFKKAQTHRKNFVNWSINQLNLTNVKEVRLEKVVNIRYGKTTSRKMSHWCNPEIRDKIISRCEELNVSVVEQPSAYRSQRCSNCGNVRKANRNKKDYKCKNCGFTCDSDLNASLNHIVDLPVIPFSLLGRKFNLGNGFFWNPDGLKTFDGEELLSPSFTKLPNY